MKDFKTDVQIYERLKDLTDAYLDTYFSVSRHFEDPMYPENSKEYLQRYYEHLLVILEDITELVAAPGHR